jgi:hypothetical protein
MMSATLVMHNLLKKLIIRKALTLLREKLKTSRKVLAHLQELV